MIDSMKATHSNAKEKQNTCRKTIGEGEGPSESQTPPLKYGYVSILGRRRVMEDPVMVVSPRKLPGGYSFFAAYGGRGRGKVAETCVDKLHQCLEKHTAEAKEKEIGWGKVVMNCFSCMFEDKSGQEGREGVIVTAVVVGVEKREVVLVNCGGSRAVLWSRGVASPLWNDRKPDESGELAGGDQCLKPSRILEPEVTVTRRTDSSEDFLIIATDSLWNVVGKEMACEIVRKCLGGGTTRLPSEGGGASQAAALLAELAIAKGSTDNISIIVIQLN